MEYNVLYEQFQQRLDARLKSEHPIGFDALIEEVSSKIPPKKLKSKVRRQIAMNAAHQEQQPIEDPLMGDYFDTQRAILSMQTAIDDLRNQINDKLERQRQKQQKQTQQKQKQQKPNVSRSGDNRYDRDAMPFTPRYTSSKRDKSRKSSKSRQGFWRNIQSGLDMLGKTSPTTKIM